MPARPGTHVENVVHFPVGAGSAASIAWWPTTEPAHDGIPSGYALNEDGIYQLRPVENGDHMPVRILSLIHI